jgi:tetratricopeptide (TPR) repeat protein
VPEFRYNFGAALAAQGRLDQAMAQYRMAIELRPNHAEAHNNLGVIHYQFGDAEQAVELHRKAIELQPHLASAYNNLSNALLALGDVDGALNACREALARDANFAPAHLSLGMLLLMNGDFTQGFEEYEWRWKLMPLALQAPRTSRPFWDGGPLDGKRILIYDEQGFGDTIQFVRFLPRVNERGGKILLACQREMLPLLSGMKGIENVFAKDSLCPEFDVHCPLLSLPRVLKLTLENIAGPEAYISAEAQRQERWKERLGEHDGRLKVGLVWAGRDTPDLRRCMALGEMAPLAQVAGVRFISLQTGHAARQIASAGFSVGNWTGELTDFAETAGLIANLDLVVTIDTAAAHLAAAMGKPTWILLKSAADWRWMKDRSDSPWYPTARLFRQERRGEWSAPISAAAEALKAVAANKC